MNEIKICSLYSGSRGNSTYISAGGAKILIDAGKSARALCAALSDIGVDIDEIDAIFITHDHNDHTSALQTLSHKHNIPIHILLDSAQIFNGLRDEKLCSCLQIYQGKGFETTVKGLHITAFPTPHDSRASVGFRLDFISDGKEMSIGYATDTGYVSNDMAEGLSGCFAVVIESNHDIEMLKSGPYTPELKKRILSRRGHLSNPECAEFAAGLCSRGTKYILLAHLSEENNDPRIAYDETFSAISDPSVRIRVAEQNSHVFLIGDNAEQE